jgi:hypothetical protein
MRTRSTIAVSTFLWIFASILAREAHAGDEADTVAAVPIASVYAYGPAPEPQPGVRPSVRERFYQPLQRRYGWRPSYQSPTLQFYMLNDRGYMVPIPYYGRSDRPYQARPYGFTQGDRARFPRPYRYGGTGWDRRRYDDQFPARLIRPGPSQQWRDVGPMFQVYRY